jgi:hypothetical protein
MFAASLNVLKQLILEFGVVMNFLLNGNKTSNDWNPILLMRKGLFFAFGCLSFNQEGLIVINFLEVHLYSIGSQILRNYVVFREIKQLMIDSLL